MATSSKVSFNVETLRARALEGIDERITVAEKEVQELGDGTAFQIELGRWREAQEARVHDLAQGMSELTNETLARFRVAPMPNDDDYRRERARAVRELRDLVATRSRILAKSEALVPNEDGSIALTKTQLAEFFDL